MNSQMTSPNAAAVPRAQGAQSADARAGDTGGREVAWHERLVRRVVGAAAVGYGASLLVHLLLLLSLSMVVVAGTGLDQLAIFAGLSEDAGTSNEKFDEIFDTKMDLPPGETDVLSISALDRSSDSETAHLQPSLASVSAAGAEGGAEGDGEAEETGHKFAMPTGGNVVTEGSFTAWTIPEDPAPGEKYTIVIQIKLPQRIKSYRSSDLSGTVVGTDRYRQELPGLQPKFLPVRKSSVQLEILVPGASELVQDTIRIRSRLLKEERELKLVF